MPLLSDLTLRNYQPDDLPAIVDLINRCWDTDGEIGRISVDEFAHTVNNAIPSPQTNIFVVATAAGTLAACGFCVPSELPNKGAGQGYIDPAQRKRGIGAHLLRHTDAHFLALASTDSRITPEMPIYVHRYTSAAVKDAVELFESEGYFLVRQFITMQMPLDEPRQPVILPEGFRITTFDPERDAHTVYALYSEGFRDHWGVYHEQTYEQWAQQLTEARFDPSLWYLAYEGDTLVGYLATNVASASQPDLGWLKTMSVLRPWRKRGLGTALLNHALYEFQRRGFKYAGLSADKDNRSNAVAIYEKLGMETVRLGYNYRKVLRGSPDDIHL